MYTGKFVKKVLVQVSILYVLPEKFKYLQGQPLGIEIK